MAKIIRFSEKHSAKLGYTKAKRKRKDNSEKNGQLNLFSGKEPQIFSIPSRFTPFEEAYILDERRDPRAKEAYLKAIEQDDYPADAFCNLGIIETEQGNASKAFNFFSNALKIDERHFESHYNIANLYFDMEDIRLAQIHYEIAIEIQPDFPNSYFNLGLLYSLKKDYKKAFVSLCRYKEIVPYNEQEKAKELLEILEKLVKTEKSNIN